MTSHSWLDTRTAAANVFGDHPSGQLENELIHHFQRNPLRVIAELERVKQAFRDGNIRNGWAVTRHALNQPEPQDVTVNDTQSRDRRIVLAEAWIRNAGHHYDLERQVEDELFDQPNGLLHPWRDDDLLRRRMVERWRTHQPQEAA